MDNMNKHEALDLAAKVDAILANGVIYFVDRVDFDDMLVYCHTWCNTPRIITALNLAQGLHVAFYNMEEIK